MVREWNGPPVVGAAPGAPPIPSGTSSVVRISGAGAPVDGVTGVGVLNKGDEYLNSINGQRYTNVGTSAATVFQLVMQA